MICSKCKQDKDDFPRPPSRQCGDCWREYYRTYRLSNLLQAQKSGRDAEARRKYGETVAEFAKRNHTSISCWICRSQDNLCLDHDHETDLVRGILCKSCNSGLAFFKENIELFRLAIRYLEQFDEPLIV